MPSGPSGGGIPPHALLLMAGLTLVSGLSWPIIKIALSEIPPWTFRSAVPLAGSAIMFLVARVARQPLVLPRNRVLPLVATAMFNVTVWNMTTAYALNLMGSGRAAVLAYTMPLWVALLSLFFLDERLTIRHAVAVGLGAAGIGLLFGSRESSAVGVILMLGAAVSWAVAVILMKRIAWNIPNLTFVAWTLFVGALPVVPVAIVAELSNLKPISSGVIVATIFMILGPTTFFYVAWFRIIILLPAVVATVGMLLSPVISVISGMLFLGEPVGWREVGALLSVCLAMALVLVRPRAKDR